jgi:hypothetical protein
LAFNEEGMGGTVFSGRSVSEKREISLLDSLGMRSEERGIQPLLEPKGRTQAQSPFVEKIFRYTLAPRTSMTSEDIVGDKYRLEIPRV